MPDRYSIGQFAAKITLDRNSDTFWGEGILLAHL